MPRAIKTNLDFEGVAKNINLPNPSDPQDAATKSYVDARLGLGPPGTDGADGLDGDTGPAGPPGARGAAGAAGAAGAPGEDGLDGDMGPPGATGSAGPTGAAGAFGAMGPPGFDGDQGDEGDFGPPGQPGVSAVGASGSATLDFGTNPAADTTTSVAVSGQAAIGSGSHVRAFIMRDATATHNNDEHGLLALILGLSCSIPTAGVGFTIFAVCETPLSGTVTVRWTWAN